jgi:CheY-like chemotaxis protein
MSSRASFIAGEYGQHRMMGQEPHFHFLFLANLKERRMPPDLATFKRPLPKSAASHKEDKMVERSLVSIVDDDESVRESLPDLIGEFGYAAQAFSSAETFLASEYVDQTRCLLLDVSMPGGMSGPDLQRELTRRGQKIPIIFITAHGDETIRPRLLEQGAVECLFKPFSDTALLAALQTALRVN